MSVRSRAFRVVRCGLLLLSLLLLGLFALAHLHRYLRSRAAVAQFEAMRVQPSAGKDERAAAEGNSGTEGRTQDSEYSPRLRQRIRLRQPNHGRTDKPLAVLRIPTLHLEVPVLEGTDAFTLNRGVGRITGTAFPGEGGNIAIAGHRDGFFRSLKDIRAGDAIELVTLSGTDVYIVDRIRVTSPAEVSVLRPRARDSVTLITCYPFYFVGRAPRRFVVEASLKQ